MSTYITFRHYTHSNRVNKSYQLISIPLMSLKFHFHVKVKLYTECLT